MSSVLFIFVVVGISIVTAHRTINHDHARSRNHFGILADSNDDANDVAKVSEAPCFILTPFKVGDVVTINKPGAIIHRRKGVIKGCGTSGRTEERICLVGHGAPWDGRTVGCFEAGLLMTAEEAVESRKDTDEGFVAEKGPSGAKIEFLDMRRESFGTDLGKSSDEEKVGEAAGEEEEKEDSSDSVMCCSAMTASCLACKRRISITAYCEEAPETNGCKAALAKSKPSTFTASSFAKTSPTMTSTNAATAASTTSFKTSNTSPTAAATLTTTTSQSPSTYQVITTSKATSTAEYLSATSAITKSSTPITTAVTQSSTTVTTTSSTASSSNLASASICIVLSFTFHLFLNLLL